MAKLKYNETLVNNAIDELGAASNQLINTEDDMRSALTIIANAQGIHHVHTDTLFNTLGFPAACQEMIEETITSIKNRATEIEAYNKEYENASFLEKLGSTAGLFLTKICEGFASAGEQIVDGFASVLGMGVGLVSKDAQNSIANFIKKDHVGDYFNNLYDTSLKSMVIKSWASEKGLACNIFKGVGTGLGYAAALAAGGAISGGLSTGTMIGAKMGAATLMSSLPAAATIAGVAGIGAGTQAGLKGGLDYNDAFCYGIKYGAIQAGTTVVFSLAFKALSKGWNLLKSKIKGTPNSTSLTVVNNNGTTGGAGTTPGGTPPGGTPSGGAGTAAAPKTGYTFKSSYTAGNGKAYTCLDDVWDDVVGGNLSKSQLRDIIKNTVGIDDSGIGHTFMSDAINVMKGKVPTTPSWRTLAQQMAGTADETMAAATGNMTGTGTGTGSSMAGTVGDDMFTSSGSSSSQVAQDLVESTTQTGAGTTQDVVEAAAGAGADDMAAASARDQLNSIRNSMNKMGENLIKDQNALTAAQTALDDAIASGADDATIASLKKAVEKAQTTYNGQYQRLLAKQQQYVDLTKNGQFNARGTESYKLIVGDDVVAGPNSIDGNITTLRAGTTTSNGTVEYRPNWTNATAKAEGQINAREFAKLLDDQYGPVVPTPTAPPTALATIGPTALATLAPSIVPTSPGTALATIGPTGLATIPPKGPTALVPTTPPGPIATIVPSIVPTVTVVPTIAPPITPVKGDTIIFGVVEPKEIVPTPSITIIPGTVEPVTTPPIITTPPVVITTPPPVITTPPIVTTAPPVITTTPPIDQEYVPIPNTGIGGSRSSRGFGVAPAVAGAVAGIAGIVGGSLLRSGTRDYREKEEEESEE